MTVKGRFICSIYIFLFFSGYSQNIPIPLVINDTIPKDSVPVTPKTNSVLKKKGQVYQINPAVDIPIIAIGSGFSLYATTKIYKKGPSTIQQINALRTSDINIFDRWAVRPYSKSLDHFSYYPFYASIPLPFIMFLLKDSIRHDFLEISFLYWESVSISGLFGAGAPFFIDRYRPYAYSAATPMDQRIIQNAKNSAFSGHVEVVATSMFFIAKIYGDYYPNTRLVMYSLATVATGGMAYIRLRAGMHFPSDVAVGSAIGILSGTLVPYFHKHRLIKNTSVSITPFTSTEARGVTFIYKLK